MKIFRLLILAAAIFVILSNGPFAAATNSSPRLIVTLRDGSRVVGASLENRLEFHSELLGDFKLPVTDIRAIDYDSTTAAKLTTVNDDCLRVRLVNSEVPVLTSFGKVELRTDTLRRLAVSLPGTRRELINVDFGAGGGRGYSEKTGAAALGTDGDFWNFYDRDNSPAPNDWRRSGTLTNLLSAAKAPTGVAMNVSDAAGAWGVKSSDPMYKNYDYPLDGGENVVTFTGLPAGEYDILAYAPEGNYSVSAGGIDYGVKTNHAAPVSPKPMWQEGVQYSRWRHVQVSDGQSLMLTVHRGVSGYAILSGMQIILSSAD